MTQPPVVLPELTREPRPSPTDLRRRTTLVGVGVGVLVLVVLVIAMSTAGRDASRAVVVDAPSGSRLAVDGDPLPALGRDGTHLLRLEPGRHHLEVTLRSGQAVEHELIVGEGEDSLLVQVRWDKVYGRWAVEATERGGKAAEEAEP